MALAMLGGGKETREVGEHPREDFRGGTHHVAAATNGLLAVSPEGPCGQGLPIVEGRGEQILVFTW